MEPTIRSIQIDELRKFADESFDMIICHNVLEYAKDRENILKEFHNNLLGYSKRKLGTDSLKWKESKNEIIIRNR